MDVLVVVERYSLDVFNRICDLAWQLEYDTGVPLSPLILSEREITLNRTHHTLFAENLEQEGMAL